MQRVMQRIDERSARLAEGPLFAFLGDTRIDPRRRLSFAPSVAHFVMTFADLYALVLPEEPAGDEYQRLVNAHTREDESHWRWFLADLAKLDSDPAWPLSQALRFLWSEGTRQTRLLSYHMCRLGFRADSLRKLVLVHCIEAAGKVTVSRVAAVGAEFTKLTDQKLLYFGEHHSRTESAHTLENEDIHRSIVDISLSPERAAELSSMVDESFDLFEAFTREMLAFATSGEGRGASSVG